LFATGVSQNQGVLDPFNGNVTAQPRFITSGNINLKPEKADTTGVGVVLQPRFIPGFTASVDYYNIKIKDSIGSVSAQFVMDNCFAGRQQFCAAIDRVTPVAGASFTIYAQPFNYVTEIASGFDIETSYRFNMDELVSDWTGSLTTRVLATLYTKKYSDNGVDTPVDYVGSHQGFVGAQAFVGVPSWRLFAQVSYANGPVTVGVAMRATSADKLVNSAVVCTSGCPASTIANNTVDFNDMPSATYFDASITYKFPTETDIEGFFGVKNITNKDPTLRPVGPAGNPQGTPTYDGALYDTLGRTFRAGVRFKM
jgi:iron complex outermembrane receptor protein